jgi:hypothetical protein
VSSSRQIFGHLRGAGALRQGYARPNIYKMSRRFGLARIAAPGHDEGEISQYPGKLEKMVQRRACCHGIGCIG